MILQSTWKQEKEEERHLFSLRALPRYRVAPVLCIQLVKHLFMWPYLAAKEPGKCSFVSGNHSQLKNLELPFSFSFSSLIMTYHVHFLHIYHSWNFLCMLIYEYITFEKLSRLSLSLETPILYMFDLLHSLIKCMIPRLKIQHTHEPSILSVLRLTVSNCCLLVHQPFQSSPFCRPHLLQFLLCLL